MVILKITSKLVGHKKTYSKLMHSQFTPQIPTSPLLPLASPWESIIISLQFMNFYTFGLVEAFELSEESRHSS
jgi:hypothetical protein